MNQIGRHKIGIFDSGLGGLSVLRTLWKETSGIDFIYFADLINAPYGQKSKKEVQNLSVDAFEFLLEKNCNAVLFACNTATSAAAHFLRDNHKIPLFGMEPAVKPAVLENKSETISVFATELTLKEEKFHNLVSSLPQANEINTIACEGLSKLIDEDDWDKAWEFLNQKISSVYPKSKVFVLGCTHYIFLKERILYNYPDVKIYDGNLGTANHIKNILSLPNSDGSNNQLDILLNTSESNYVHLANRITKTITPNFTLSLINAQVGDIHVESN